MTSDSRETTLHLCVRYNSIGALKLLVDRMTKDEVIQCVDEDGNTLLHVAVIYQQIEVRVLYTIKIVNTTRMLREVFAHTQKAYTTVHCIGAFSVLLWLFLVITT